MELPLHMAVTRTYHAQKNTLRPLMGPLGLSPGQPKILYHLLNGPCIQKEIAQSCDIEPATVSRLLDNMETQGLIIRTVEKNNRRATSVSITAKGKDAYKNWKKICADVDATALRGFSLQEQEEFALYLRRMYSNLTGREMDE